MTTGPRFFIELSARIFMSDDYTHLEWDGEEVTVFDRQTGEPFTVYEFEKGSATRTALDNLNAAIEAEYDVEPLVIKAWPTEEEMNVS